MSRRRTVGLLVLGVLLWITTLLELGALVWCLRPAVWDDAIDEVASSVRLRLV
jgi:hypothetical protein